MSKQSTLRIICDEFLIAKRAHEVVKELVNRGHTHDEIARLTDSTVVSLLDGGSPTRAQYTALATHFNVSRLWLWTGLGPMILDEAKLKLRIV